MEAPPPFVQHREAGHPPRLAPDAVPLADDERLHVAGAVRVIPPALHEPAAAHDTDASSLLSRASRAARPGTGCALPQLP